MNLRQKLLGPGLFSLMIKVAGAALGYLMFVVFARMLSADDYGQFAAGFNLAIVLGAIGGVGTATGIMRYWPAYRVEKDDAGSRGLIAFGLSLNLLGGAISLSIITLGAWFFGFDIWLALAVGVFGLITCLSDFTTNLLRSMGSVFNSMLPREVLWRLIAPISAAWVIGAGYGLTAPMALFLCTATLALLLAWQMTFITRQMSRELTTPGKRNDWSKLKPSLMPLWLAGVAYALIQQLDVVIVGGFLGGAEAGAYFAAQKTAMLLSLVLIAAGLVVAPQISELYQSKQKVALQKLLRMTSLGIVAVTFVGFLILLLIGKHLLALFNPSYVSAYPVLIVMGLGFMLDALAGPTAYLMQMTSYERHYLKIILISYLLVICSQLIFIPIYGAMGAAVSSACGVILWNLWAITLLRKKAKLDPSILGLIFNPQKEHGNVD